jgi:hypothetical protein
MDGPGAAVGAAVCQPAICGDDGQLGGLGGASNASQDPVVCGRGEDHPGCGSLGAGFGDSVAVEHDPYFAAILAAMGAACGAPGVEACHPGEQAFAMLLRPPAGAVAVVKETGVEDVEAVDEPLPGAGQLLHRPLYAWLPLLSYIGFGHVGRVSRGDPAIARGSVGRKGGGVGEELRGPKAGWKRPGRVSSCEFGKASRV